MSLIFGLITQVRNRLYDWQLLKEKKFDTHTIGVGNLAVGGAGKTPMVEYLIRLLNKENTKIATLSRGYKRKTKGYVLADENSTAQDIGDEPLIYKSKYKNILVAVDGNRIRGVEQLLALNHNAPSVILLDDVFQHRAIRCGLNILVTDYNNLYFNDSMLPSGTLRENKTGVSRADVVVVSKTPDNLSAVEMRQITKDVKPLAHQKVFYSYLKYGELYSATNRDEKIDTLNDLFRYRVISFAGIANAQPMVNYLKEYAAEVTHLPFADHYEYQQKDLEEIEKYYQTVAGGNKIIVTTEKDLMRLKNEPLWQYAQRLNIYILPVEVSFKDKEEEFDQFILKYVRTNRIYHEKYSREEQQL
ncbi:MAG: tetraacyldisaccharide 4'-kinase [Bacteroidia bacterium]|nr:tetraacyldisaccharide 4'-kinase [Bacteroidia bacterium]